MRAIGLRVVDWQFQGLFKRLHCRDCIVEDGFIMHLPLQKSKSSRIEPNHNNDEDLELACHAMSLYFLKIHIAVQSVSAKSTQGRKETS